MATAADNIGLEQPRSGFAAFADRWIYVFMAALFITTVLVGFIPDSNRMLANVAAGARPPLPPVLHVHAVLMGSWLSLLLVQAVLMATGRDGIHKQLGLLGMVLAPAMVIAGFFLIPTMDGQIVEGVRHGPPAVSSQLRGILPLVMNIMLIQIRAGFVFAVLVAIGLVARRTDPEVHKRLMFLATLAPLPAATDRMIWLPSSMPGAGWTCDIWPLVILAPMFFWDLYRLKRIHRAYWIWIAVSIVPATLMHALWGSQWWFRTALGILGAGDLAQ